MFWKTSLVMIVLSAGAFAIGKIAADAGIWVAVEAVLVLVSSCAFFALISPPRHGVSIANALGGQRAVGPGLHFLGWPGEWKDKVVELIKLEIHILAHPDTAGRDVASVRVVVGCEPSVPYLPEYLRWFESDKREAAVKSRIEGLLTKLGHLCGSFDAIYAGGDDISAKLMLLFQNDTAGGMSLEEYYGLKVNYIFLSDITPPEIVRNAAALKRVAEEQVKMLRIKMQGYEEEIDRMVAKDPGSSRHRALEFLMSETGTIPQKKIKYEYEAGPELIGVLKGFGKRLKGGKS